mmetsp:Transcript_26518/g.79223  ORF Transcript_26518/g.79223 Transcript_26518/m.79223 type:complete len:239 (+) Transcript_26518:636-1352(+)
MRSSWPPSRPSARPARTRRRSSAPCSSPPRRGPRRRLQLSHAGVSRAVQRWRRPWTTSEQCARARLRSCEACWRPSSSGRGSRRPPGAWSPSWRRSCSACRQRRTNFPRRSGVSPLPLLRHPGWRPWKLPGASSLGRFNICQLPSLRRHGQGPWRLRGAKSSRRSGAPQQPSPQRPGQTRRSLPGPSSRRRSSDSLRPSLRRPGWRLWRLPVPMSSRRPSPPTCGQRTRRPCVPRWQS